MKELNHITQMEINQNPKDLTFSQRSGIIPSTKDPQMKSMDMDLRNGLWNLIKTYYLDQMFKSTRIIAVPYFRMFAVDLWHNFYKSAIDTIPNDREAELYIRFRYFKFEWNEVYDFVEFILRISYNRDLKEEFINEANNILEREFSGYRIINNIIAPISNTLEFTEASDAISKTNGLTALHGANIHLNNALTLLSDKQNPNYRNSIKESISAVEATCKIITGESTLGLALNKLEPEGLEINKQLKAGFDKIYAYTNSKGSGIRHAIVEQPKEPDFYDAKYMLISCSAFINYLIGKAAKIGTKINPPA